MDRPSSRSVTSQLTLFEREDAQYSFVSWAGRTAFYGTYRVNKVRVKCITSFISSYHLAGKIASLHGAAGRIRTKYKCRRRDCNRTKTPVPREAWELLEAEEAQEARESAEETEETDQIEVITFRIRRRPSSLVSKFVIDRRWRRKSHPHDLWVRS